MIENNMQETEIVNTAAKASTLKIINGMKPWESVVLSSHAALHRTSAMFLEEAKPSET